MQFRLESAWPLRMTTAPSPRHRRLPHLGGRAHPHRHRAGRGRRLGRRRGAVRLPCLGSFRDRSPGKDWRFPSKLSEDGSENSKRIVGLGRIPASDSRSSPSHHICEKIRRLSFRNDRFRRGPRWGSGKLILGEVLAPAIELAAGVAMDDKVILIPPCIFH